MVGVYPPARIILHYGTYTVEHCTLANGLITLLIVVMGAALSSRTQWTSASEINKGKLEFTPQNELLLNDVVKYVETLVNSHPTESEVTFKEPFQWHTKVKPAEFGSLNFGSLGYNIRLVFALIRGRIIVYNRGGCLAGGCTSAHGHWSWFGV